jgi:nitroimidazol reductase NimA-like FMN-containing flavoprotein (pyridoxamine 5'-phosphate oxidase superfamily)
MTMRALSESEIKKFLSEWTWGTLIAIDGDGPYAIELSYAFDGDCIYCGSMPDGRMSRCITNNSRVAFKICDSTRDTSRFRAAIAEGTVRKMTERAEIVKGLEVLYKKLGFPASRIEKRADQLCVPGKSSSFYRIGITALGGRAIGY